jgi:hypothetical protein
MTRKTLTPEEFSAFLEHHGVKGQKWGVRRNRSRVKTSRKTASRTTFQKPPSRLTDAQLNSRIKRMELEKRYKELNKNDVTEGKKFTSDVLKSSGKQVATTIIAGAALLAVGSALKKKLGPEAAAAITGKKLSD